MVLSRHQGPAISSDMSRREAANTADGGNAQAATRAPTSAPALITHLEDVLLPRVQPYLERVKRMKLELEHEVRSTELGVDDGLSAPPFRAALHIRRGLWIAVASSA